MIALVLWALVTIDAMFAGFRDAVGRSPLLRKRDLLFAGAMRGAVIGQIISVLFVGLVAGLCAASGDLNATWHAHLGAGLHLAQVYVPYAAVVVAALLVYAIPNPDVSSLATVTVLGPFTLARPLVIVGGGGWALIHLPPSLPALSVILACGSMVLLGPLMSRRWATWDPLSR